VRGRRVLTDTRTLFRRYVLHTHEVRRGQKQKNAAIHTSGGTLAKAPAGPLTI